MKLDQKSLRQLILQEIKTINENVKFKDDIIRDLYVTVENFEKDIAGKNYELSIIAELLREIRDSLISIRGGDDTPTIAIEKLFNNIEAIKKERL